MKRLRKWIKEIWTEASKVEKFVIVLVVFGVMWLFTPSDPEESIAAKEYPPGWTRPNEAKPVEPTPVKPDETPKAQPAKSKRTSNSLWGSKPVEDNWTARHYRVIEVEDMNIFYPMDRKRRKIVIVAPTAVSNSDRIATLIEAMGDNFRSGRPIHTMVGFLIAFPSKLDDGAIAKALYSNDGCGWAKEDCTGEFWTDVWSANGPAYTREHEEFYKAWRLHRDSYPDEDSLKDFLAELFDKDREHIDKISREVWQADLAFMPSDMELPSHMKGRISWP